MDLKHMIILGVNVVALILCCAGTATPITVITQTVSSYTLTGTTGLFTTCVSVDPPLASVPNECKSFSMDDIKCDSTKGRIQASRAFCIISCLVFGAACALAGGRLFLSGVPIFTGPFPLLSVVIAFVTSLIAWAIEVSLFTDPGCDAPVPDGLKLGAGPILFIVAWILSIANLVLEFLARNAVAGISVVANNDDPFTRGHSNNNSKGAAPVPVYGQNTFKQNHNDHGVSLL